MPDILDQCVRDVMQQGKSEDSAWAICRSALGLSKDKEDIKEIMENANKIMKEKKFKSIDELPEPDLFDVNDVEIFASGVWNNEKYTEEDLDKMVSAFNEVGHLTKPFLKIGHSESQKLIAKDEFPSVGFVKNLRRFGDKLIADFKRVPRKVAQLIRNGAYSRVSSEIFFNIKVLGKTFPRMLKAVSLLGGEMPAVVTLDDILALNAAYGAAQSYSSDAEKTEKYEYLKEDRKMEVKELEKRLAESERLLKEQNEELESLRQFKNEIDDKDKDEMPKMKKRLKQLEEENTQLKKKISELTRKNEELETESKEYSTKIRHQEINTKLDKMIKNGEIVPAKRELMFALLESESQRKFSIDGKESSIDELVTKLFSKDSQLNTGEDTEAGKRQDESEDSLVQKYAEEHKVSYKDALLALASEGKIKE